MTIFAIGMAAFTLGWMANAAFSIWLNNHYSDRRK